MINLVINGKQVFVPRGSSVLEACKQVGIDIPRFCYHENLSVAGNCRMCLVEIEKSPKPIASCAMPVSNNMVILTDTPLIKKARENVLETLLLNHPLDCPICDQAGECDLQDQTRIYGGDYSRFYTLKRTVEDKNLGPLIKTIMTRCIHCTRCVRFATEIAGVDTLGTLNRGVSTEIGTYIDKLFQTEISGNVIDLCPVGALTSKPYAFVSRPWELRRVASIDALDSTGSNITIEFKETEIVRILPRYSKSINTEWISDKIRYTFDSLRRFRIQALYNKKDGKYVVSNWDTFFFALGRLLKRKKVLILIQANLDTKSAALLRFLNDSLNIRVCFADTKIIFKNFLGTQNAFSEIHQSDSCFLLGSNVKIESPILQIKLRERFLKGAFSICAVGTPFFNTVNTKFLNLTPSFLTKVLKGKSIFQQTVSCCKKPAFFVGKAILRRSLFRATINAIREINPNCLCYFLDLFPNTKTFEFLNFPSLTQKNLDWADTVIFFNSEESFLIRSLLNKKGRQILWANTHGSNLAEKANVILPVATFFECIYHFINSEGRLQKTLASVKKTREVLSYWEFSSLLSFRAKRQGEKIFDLMMYSYQATDSFLRSKFNSRFLSIPSYSLTTFYPFKSNIEDFHLTGNIARASGIMGKCSHAFRNCQTNFIAIK